MQRGEEGHQEVKLPLKLEVDREVMEEVEEQ